MWYICNRKCNGSRKMQWNRCDMLGGGQLSPTGARGREAINVIFAVGPNSPEVEMWLGGIVIAWVEIETVGRTQLGMISISNAQAAARTAINRSTVASVMGMGAHRNLSRAE